MLLLNNECESGSYAMKQVLASAMVLCGLAITVANVQAQNLLTDGNFENFASIPDWVLQESIFDQTTMMNRGLGDINSGQQHVFKPHAPGTLALWLRGFAGGMAAGPDNLTNVVLSQTRPASVGEQYTFTGWSRFETNYSGGVDTLAANGPLGAVATPTTDFFKLEFLDSGGGVLASPAPLDVKADRRTQSPIMFANDDLYYQHTLMGTAPVGTQGVRVTADALKMVWNGGGNESAFYDDFSLRAASASGTELLLNQSLETAPASFNPAWTVTQVPGGNIPTDPTISTADFASRPEGLGQLGTWLRSFTGSESLPADAILEQTVAGVPGGQYSFSGWSNFQTNYSGGAAGFPTQTLFEMEFLNASSALIGSTLVLDLKADGQTNGGGWRQHTLQGTAPAGTANVRVRAKGLDMVTNPAGGQQSAFLDDLSLTLATAVVPGDYDGSGAVGSGDLNLVLNNWNATVPPVPTGWIGDQPAPGVIGSVALNRVLNNWGNVGGDGASFGAVPEPGALVSASLALAGSALVRRRRTKEQET
jgi:hypothetical protein